MGAEVLILMGAEVLILMGAEVLILMGEEVLILMGAEVLILMKEDMCVCLVCSPLCLQYQVEESCAYVNTSRTPRDTRNFMQVHLVRGAKPQETAQSARGI